MSEYIPLTPVKIKVKDAFSLGDLIKIMNEWRNEHNFVDREGSNDDNGQETVYSHKVTGGGAVLDLWMWWRYLKYPLGTNKDTSYVRYVLNVDLHFLGDNAEVEVMHKGKKVKLNKGEIEIEIKPFVEMDFRGEWKKEGLLKIFHDVFKKRVYKKEITNHIEYMYGELYKLHGAIKLFFNLPTFMPEEALSQPPKGLI